MRLALRLGRTLGELGRSMSADEFSLWLALYVEEPWDESRADLRAGIVASAVANFAGKMIPEGAQDTSPADFMPFLRPEPQPEEAPDPLAHFAQFT